MHTTENGAEIADNNKFLTARQLFTRWGCKKTKGYTVLKSPGFPPRIGGGYRLDMVRAWEDLQGTASTSDETTASSITTYSGDDLAPSRRTRRVAPKGGEL